MDKQDKIAVLIDAENVSKKYIKLIMDEVSDYGIATYKRIYGDFTNPSVMAWQDALRDFALTPVFQFNYTKGKNASDSCPDYRRDGYLIFGKSKWILSGNLRQ